MVLKPKPTTTTKILSPSTREAQDAHRQISRVTWDYLRKKKQRKQREAALKNVHRIWGFRDDRGNTWWFDAYAADRAVRWIEAYMRHTNGEWDGKPFKLAPWQRKVVRQVFGWKGADGYRRFRQVWLEIPRGNGKSTFASAVANYLLIADNEPAAMIYSVASNRDQACLVYDDARAMIEAHPALNAQVETHDKGMMVGSTRSRFIPLGSKNLHGLKPHGVIGDEVHEWSNRDQHEAVSSAFGKRRQPIRFYITTAGDNRQSLCWELHRQAVQVIRGDVYLPHIYARIWAANPQDDWRDERVWFKANPGLKYGAPKIEDLRQQCEEAQSSPAAENSFKRLKLNLWTDATTRWVPSGDWDDASRQIDWSLLRGCEAYGGLDLAAVKDLSALALWFPPTNLAVPGRWVLAVKFWCPEANIEERTKSDDVPYEDWANRGLITATPGDTTDYDMVEKDILAINEIHPIIELGYDPWNARQMAQRLTKKDLDCAEVPQYMRILGPSTARMEKMILGGDMAHGGHEILSWNMANVMVWMGPNGHYKPDKKKSTQRIDGVAAALNGVALILEAEAEDEEAENDLNSRGLETW